LSPLILVVEEPGGVPPQVAVQLQAAGFIVRRTENGPESVRLALQLAPDLLVLASGSAPDMSYLFLHRYRREAAGPVLMLAEGGSTAERLLGLALGADDYVARPVSVEELVARIRAILRRTSGSRRDTIPPGEMEPR
jgi:DNA-binding response OmpR family regulator